MSAADAAIILHRFAGRVVVLDVDVTTDPDAVILHIRPAGHIGVLTRHLAITGTDLAVVELHSGDPILAALADGKRTRMGTLPKPHGGGVGERPIMWPVPIEGPDGAA